MHKCTERLCWQTTDINKHKICALMYWTKLGNICSLFFNYSLQIFSLYTEMHARRIIKNIENSKIRLNGLHNSNSVKTICGTIKELEHKVWKLNYIPCVSGFEAKINWFGGSIWAQGKFCYCPICLKKNIFRFKSGQNWLKNNPLASFY